MAATVSTTPDTTSDEEQVPSPEQVKARKIAAGYTALADFFVAHPHLVKHLYSGVQVTQAVAIYSNTAREVIEEFVAAARQTVGVTITEYYSRPYGGIRLTFGSVQFRVYAQQQYLGVARTARTAKYRPLLGDTTGAGAQ